MSDFERIREGLREIDIAAHNSWNLGKNMVVGWTPRDSGIALCIAPCFRVFAEGRVHPQLFAGRRIMDEAIFADACKILQVRPIRVDLPFKIGKEQKAGEVDPETIDTVIRRYSIVRIGHRAVMMMEMMGFSTASPIEQIAQLASLEYSINNAGKKLGDVGLDVELARSTAGDGIYYVWNRHTGLDADFRAYAAFLLILCDNALARTHAGAEAHGVPALRACFTIGPHYSYHQVEGTKPRSFEYATGEVTITLARLLTKSLQGQILIGNFLRPDPAGTESLDTLMFLFRAEAVLQHLAGMTVGEHTIKELRSLVTSGSVNGSAYPVVKYVITDKHGYHHEAFNLRAKMKRESSDPLDLGLRPEELTGFNGVATAYALPGR